MSHVDGDPGGRQARHPVLQPHGARRARRRGGAGDPLRPGAGRGQRHDRRLRLGHLDRPRRGGRHRARLRRLRHGPHGLRGSTGGSTTRWCARPCSPARSATPSRRSSIIVDVGRYWGMWKIPTYVSWWNFDSALLEVALCVMTYVVVLWIEFSPVDPRALARLRDPWPARLRRVGRPPARPGPALDHRPRPAAPHHAPVVAGHGDDAARLEAAPALVHAAPAPPLPGDRPLPGLRRGDRRVHGLLRMAFKRRCRDPAARLPGSASWAA